MAPMSLPPGFRFHPTDEELVAYYLDRKINGQTIELEIIPEVDLYKCEPWDLPEKSFLPGKDMEWYFYSPRDRKYPNGSRTNRATKAGYWKATGKDRPVHSQKKAIGMKKTLVYYRGRAPHGIRTNWVMHEYRLVESLCGSVSAALKESYALCRVFKKTVQIPKSKSDQVKWDITEKESMYATMGEDVSETEVSNRTEPEENFNHDHCYKFPFDITSSGATQRTPAQTGIVDDFQAPFNPYEANSCGNMYSFGLDSSSNLFQDLDMRNYTSMQYQLPYPPLELEDFPQINIADTKLRKPEMMEEYMMYDKCRDNMNGTLEEIFSLSSSQDNSVSLSMQD